jgi:uncharacterized membrane protein
MSEHIQSVSYQELGLDAIQRNKVLRNTYWLLAITLIPTVLGAWLGVSTGLGQLFSGGLGLVFFLAGTFGFIYAIENAFLEMKGNVVVIPNAEINKRLIDGIVSPRFIWFPDNIHFKYFTDVLLMKDIYNMLFACPLWKDARNHE